MARVDLVAVGGVDAEAGAVSLRVFVVDRSSLVPGFFFPRVSMAGGGGGRVQRVEKAEGGSLHASKGPIMSCSSCSSCSRDVLLSILCSLRLSWTPWNLAPNRFDVHDTFTTALLFVLLTNPSSSFVILPSKTLTSARMDLVVESTGGPSAPFSQHHWQQ